MDLEAVTCCTLSSTMRMILAGLVVALILGLGLHAVDAQKENGGARMGKGAVQRGDPSGPKKSRPRTSIAILYDRFERRTFYDWRWRTGDETADDKGFIMSAPFKGMVVSARFKGKRSRGRPVAVSVTFVFAHKSRMFLRTKKIVFLVDRKRFVLDARHTGSPTNGDVREIVTAVIPVRSLKHIARAKKVEFRIATWEGTIPKPILESLGTYAKRLR